MKRNPACPMWSPQSEHEWSLSPNHQTEASKKTNTAKDPLNRSTDTLGLKASSQGILRYSQFHYSVEARWNIFSSMK